MNIWTGLLAVPFVALTLAAFAPLPDSLDKFLKGLALVFWLVYFCAYFWHDRRKQIPDQAS